MVSMQGLTNIQSVVDIFIRHSPRRTAWGIRESPCVSLFPPEHDWPSLRVLFNSPYYVLCIWSIKMSCVTLILRHESVRGSGIQHVRPSSNPSGQGPQNQSPLSHSDLRGRGWLLINAPMRGRQLPWTWIIARQFENTSFSPKFGSCWALVLIVELRSEGTPLFIQCCELPHIEATQGQLCLQREPWTTPQCTFIDSSIVHWKSSQQVEKEELMKHWPCRCPVIAAGSPHSN